MRSIRSHWLVLFLVLVLHVPSRGWTGGLADEAELHFQMAAEKYLAKDFRGALEHFLLSNRLVPNRNVVYNIARTYEQLERFPDAFRYYMEALEGEGDAATKANIEAAVARIAPKVAILKVTTEPAGATIYIDRKDLGSRGLSPRPLALPEGRYKVLVELSGYEPAEAEILEAKLGTEVPVNLSLVRIVGTLAIDGHEGVTATADADEGGRESCLVPCRLQLSPGLHTIHLERKGFQSSARQVNIEARGHGRILAELEPLVGSVVVHADERDALVEIDGRSVGFTPVVVPNIPVGERTVRITLRGFKPVERTIQVEANEQVALDGISLVPLQEVTAASRFVETVDDAPGSVSIVSHQELQAFAYPTIAEAVRGLRGVYTSFDGIYASIGVRGLGLPNDFGNRLLVMSDGLSLNDDILYSSYVGYDGRTDLADVERIEVVRGPGSLLYGTGAVSGVINLVMKPRDLPSSAHGRAGVADDGVAQGRVGFNLDLGEGRGVWASLSGARSDGYSVSFDTVDDGGAPIARTARATHAFDAYTLAGAGWWGPIALQWFHTWRDAAVPFGPFGFKFDDPGSRYEDRRTAVEARFDGAVTEQAELMIRAHLNSSIYDGRYLYEDFELEERYEGDWVGAEARLALKLLDNDLRLSAGAEAQRHFVVSLLGDSIEEGERAPYLEEERPYSLGAAYAVADATPTSWLRLQAGARLDVYSTFGATVNPRVAAILKPGPSDVLKLILGRAFRAPSAYEQFYNDGGETQIAANSGAVSLEPETSYTGELEYSHELDEAWSIVGGVHATYVKGIIETVGEATEESPLQYVNSDEPVLSAGAEAELRREWRQGWMLVLSYAYQLTRYLERPVAVETASLRLPNAPEHLASVRGVAPIVPSLALLAVRLSFEGPRRISLAGDSTTESALLMDVVLSGEVKRYGLTYAAGVYNAMDWQRALPVTDGGLSPTFPQPGRSFRLSLGLQL